MVIPTHLVKGTTRQYVPLDLVFDPAGPIPPSHALSAGRTVCHPITADFPVEGHETPALTHFATCPARKTKTQTA